MKKHIISIGVSALLCMPVSGRSLNVECGNVIYSFPAPEMGMAEYEPGVGFVICDRVFPEDSIDLMEMTDNDEAPNTVRVNWTNEGATVYIAGNLATLVEATADGGYVSVTQSDNVSDATGEITYSLEGESQDGSFTLNGSYKATIELRGLNLKSNRGAAIDIQNGKRISISAKKDTENFLSDSPDGSQKAALYCKGHLELKGKGSLTVSGHKGYAIAAKEYVEVKNLSLNVTEAAKDGINCAQYYLQESGAVSITGVADDGIQVDYKDAENREQEDTGTITILDGTLTADITGRACKGLKAEGDVNVSGGTVVITTSGKGLWDSSKQKTKASACIGADGNVTVEGGELTLTSTGSGGKGISPDGAFTMTSGNLRIRTSGGVFAYTNGQEYDGYTGNLDRLNSDYKSSAKGIKADGPVIIDGGTLRVLTSGRGAEGIESKTTLTINGGSIFVKAYDDAINSSSHLYVRGGETTVISTNNDGLDANGHIYIEGGRTLAFGAGAPECGIDANSEEGYTVFFLGGELLAVGSSNSVPTTDASTQAYVSASGTTSAGKTISVKNGEETLVTFTVPEEYGNNIFNAPGGGPGGGGGNGQMLVTCPGLTEGHSYTFVNGTSSSTVTAVRKGSSRPW